MRLTKKEKKKLETIEKEMKRAAIRCKKCRRYKEGSNLYVSSGIKYCQHCRKKRVKRFCDKQKSKRLNKVSKNEKC